MIDQPDMQRQEPQPGKLILPAPPGEEQQSYHGGQPAQLRPEQLIRHRTQAAPKDSIAKIAYYWRKDPAYKVLIIAMTMVLLAGIVFVSLASAAFLGHPNLFASSYSPNPTTRTNPTGTVDLRPTFSPPGGGSGSNQSSQPPAQATPVLQPTSPTGDPSPTPGNGGTLTVQIAVPSVVTNGSRVDVAVNTSEPGVTVLLVIRYNVQPFRATAGPVTTDDNGNGTIPWFVLVYGFRQNSAQATVYAIATDQNGQRAKSDTFTVQVVG